MNCTTIFITMTSALFVMGSFTSCAEEKPVSEDIPSQSSKDTVSNESNDSGVQGSLESRDFISAGTINPSKGVYHNPVLGVTIKGTQKFQALSQQQLVERVEKVIEQGIIVPSSDEEKALMLSSYDETFLLLTADRGMGEVDCSAGTKKDFGSAKEMVDSMRRTYAEFTDSQPNLEIIKTRATKNLRFGDKQVYSMDWAVQNHNGSLQRQVYLSLDHKDFVICFTITFPESPAGYEVFSEFFDLVENSEYN